MHFLFSVEGNIGSGKSTLLKLLKEQLKTVGNREVVYLPEPVNFWESVKDGEGKNIIEKFYENPEKYAFPLQMLACVTQLHQLKETLKRSDNVIIISERSVFSSKNTFAKMLRDDNKIDAIEYNIYCKWVYEFLEDISLAGIIYVKSDPEICEKRIKKRNRRGETPPLSYLQNCHKYHEKWLNNETAPVLNLEEPGNSWVEKIEMFVGGVCQKKFLLNTQKVSNFSQNIL